jgi:hypothetical protein
VDNQVQAYLVHRICELEDSTRENVLVSLHTDNVVGLPGLYLLRTGNYEASTH